MTWQSNITKGTKNGLEAIESGRRKRTDDCLLVFNF